MLFIILIIAGLFLFSASSKSRRNQTPTHPYQNYQNQNRNQDNNVFSQSESPRKMRDVTPKNEDWNQF